jgi:hypothetical protein
MTQSSDEIIPVIFRKDYEGGQWHITAVFPTEPGLPESGSMTCYAHVGQHSSCSYGWYVGTKAANPEEYSDLREELESIGYKLRVYKRMTRQHRDECRAQLRRFLA